MKNSNKKQSDTSQNTNTKFAPHQAHAQHNPEQAEHIIIKDSASQTNTKTAQEQGTATKQQNQRPPHNQPPPQHRPPHNQRPPQNNQPEKLPQGSYRPPQNRPDGTPSHQNPNTRPPHNQRPPQNRPPHNQRPPQQRPPSRPTPPPHTPPNNTINFPPTASIHKQRFERDFNFNNTTVLLMELENFLIETQNKRAERKINSNLESQANSFVKTAITELYPLAIKDFLSATSNTYPFNPYATMLKYNITYNKNCHLSTYRDNYVFTGGAHGTTKRLASTYNIQNGNTVPLSSYFKRGTNYKDLILSEIHKQATKNMQENPNIYFDDYIDQINSTFNEESYYLSKNGLVVYFGQYDIAPYVSGIIEFLIPYSMLNNPPTCH